MLKTSTNGYRKLYRSQKSGQLFIIQDNYDFDILEPFLPFLNMFIHIFITFNKKYYTCQSDNQDMRGIELIITIA